MGLLDNPFGRSFIGSDFASAEARSHGELLGEFGEIWEHIPTIRPNRSQATPDPAQQTYLLWAEFTADGENLKLGLEQGGVDTRFPMLTLRKCDVQIPIKTCHWFKRCSTGEVYEVKDYLPDSMSGVEIHLNQIGLPT